jgi:hypothetical protein
MQHDWLQGPAIDGGPRDLRDDPAGKNFLYCMAANAALGPSEKGPPDPTMARGLSPRQSPRGGPPAPRARNMTPFSFDKESAFVSAVGTKTKHSPGGYDEQWNYGQNQGRYQ